MVSTTSIHHGFSSTDLFWYRMYVLLILVLLLSFLQGI